MENSVTKNDQIWNKLFEQYSTQLRNIDIIATSDVRAPRFIFDRKKIFINYDYNLFIYCFT